MERQELEARLENDEVFYTMGKVRRDLQRPIPNWVKDRKDYGHERGQLTQVMGNYIGCYNIFMRKGLDVKHETFKELSEREEEVYNGIIDCIDRAINDKYILI
jgi:hypothetical protein